MSDFLAQIKPYVSSEVFILSLVLGSFAFGVFIYKRTKMSLLQPLLIATLIIIPFLKLRKLIILNSK